MGNNHDKYFGKDKRKVVLLGLDKSGKSCFVEYLKTGHFVTDYAATSDMEISEIKKNNLTWIVFDCAGGDRQRVFWRHHYGGAQGVVYFIDLDDADRMKTAIKHFKEVLSEKELSQSKILLFFNKSDKQKGDKDKLIEEFELKDLLSHRTNVLVGSLKKSEGINEGIEWLVKNMVSI